MSGEYEANVAVESLIDWWALAGVTSAVSESPVNWLQPSPRIDAIATSDAVASVETHWPDTLDGFHNYLAGDAGLPEMAWPQFSGENKRILPVGPTVPALMIICDMPDADDMMAGHLLSGDSGRLLDAMMAAIGLDRSGIYLSSLAIARPAGGMVTDVDSARLAQRMRHHISLVGPRRILLLGEKASRALLPTVDGMNPTGLRPVNHDGGTIDAIATSHPRLLLKHPAAKMGCWRQLQLLIEAQPA